MPKIILDSAEYTWLSKTSAKWAKYLAEVVDPKLTSEREKALWKKMEQKFPSILGDVGDVEVTLSKLEIGELRSVAKVTVIQIKADVIGAYEQRQKDNPEKSNFYQGYIDKNKEKVEGIQGFIKKLESV